MLVHLKRAVLVATVAAIMIAAAGCSSAPGMPGQTIPLDPGTLSYAAQAPLGQSCTSIDDTTFIPTQELPADVVLASASRCIYENQIVAGDGVWLMRVDQIATSGLDALADALRLPDQQSEYAIPCPPSLQPPTVIFVTDTFGRPISPHLPATVCDGVQIAVANVIAALPWKNAHVTQIKQTKTQEELTALCADNEQPAIELTAAGYAPSFDTPDGMPIEQIVCRYDLDTNPATVVTAPNGKTFKAGKPTDVYMLDVTKVIEFYAVTATADVAGPCDRPQAPFVVLFNPNDTIPTVSIELGGCNRALWGGLDYLQQLDSATVTRLLG